VTYSLTKYFRPSSRSNSGLATASRRLIPAIWSLLHAFTGLAQVVNPKPSQSDTFKAPIQGEASSEDKSTPPTLDTVKLCINLMDNVIRGIQNLKTSAANLKQNLKLPENTDLLGTWTNQSCETKADRKRILSQAAKFLTQHSNRAGLILRLKDPAQDYNKDILFGFRAAFADLGLNPDQNIVVADPTGFPDSSIAVARLVLEHSVSLISGGVDRQEADLISRWATAFRMPAFVLNRDPALSQKRPQVFRVFPSPESLATTIAGFLKLGMVKRIAVLRPNTPGALAETDALKNAALTNAIEVSAEQIFEPEDFPSIELAAKKLFKVSEGERRGELSRVMSEARAKARKAGQQFNPKMVTLPPLVEFDAVFIPADFRTIRHIAKVFQFLGVKDLRMIGDYQWRSRSLIDPFDSFFQYSLFADFFGRYTDLPKSITPTNAASMFLTQKEARTLDYRALGYFAGRAAALTLKQPPTKRNILYRGIVRLNHPPDSTYFGNGKLFDAQGLSIFPTQLLKISEKGISLATPEDALMPSPSPTPTSAQNNTGRNLN
jgi:hypothetical protein